MSSHLARLEALLFVAGEDGLSLRTMAQLLEMPVTGLTQSLEKLQAKYEADEDSALCLLESSNTYKLVTKADFASLLREYSKTPINQSLSRASLEVLSIIAYKQPITRAEVDAIRVLIPVAPLLSFRLSIWYEKLVKKMLLVALTFMRRRIIF